MHVFYISKKKRSFNTPKKHFNPLQKNPGHLVQATIRWHPLKRLGGISDAKGEVTGPENFRKFQVTHQIEEFLCVSNWIGKKTNDITNFL